MALKTLERRVAALDIEAFRERRTSLEASQEQPSTRPQRQLSECLVREELSERSVEIIEALAEAVKILVWQNS